MKTLRSILPSNIEITNGDLDVEINGIEYDSRKIKKGNLFVALPGTKIDGSSFIYDVLERGAAAVIFESNRKNIESAAVKVKNARQALSETSALFYDNPSQSMSVYGITGTKGKTTISYIIQNILKQAYNNAFRIGTVEYDLGYEKLPAANTTPESAALQKMCFNALQHGITHGIIEVSSHALKNWRVENMTFAVAGFTNLSLEHTEFHPDMEDYFNTKKRLFTEIASKNKPCLIGIDCDYGVRMAKECKEAGLNVKTVSVHDKSADYYCDNIHMVGSGSDFTICTSNGERNHCHISMAGEFNVFNAVMAAAMCNSNGVDWNYICSGIMSLEHVPGRLESIPNNKGINVVVDYAHSPASLDNVLKAMRGLTKGKLITVFGCGGNRSREKRPIMGKVAFENSDIIVVTSDNPRNEQPHEIIDQIVKGIPEEHGEKVIIVDSDRRNAIFAALDRAQEGDSVIIAGKGHETGQYFGDKVIPFDDREVAREYFEARDR